MRPSQSPLLHGNLPSVAVDKQRPFRHPHAVVSSRMIFMHRAIVMAAIGVPAALGAQWTNRYPKLAGYAHHVYVEGYELPVISVGPSDPAPSPDGRSIAIASRGWLWLLDPATGAARRITRGASVDSRPAWSRDGRSLAFVRDDGRSLAIVTMDVATGAEREIERGMVLDPVFSQNGRSLTYASASAGDIDLWSVDLVTGTRTRLTMDAGLEVRPQMHPDGERIIYMKKSRGGLDAVRMRTLSPGADSALVAGSLLSQTRPALSPDGSTIAYNWPGITGGELRVANVERPAVSILLAGGAGGEPLTPAWSHDGKTVFFAEADSLQRMRLYRVSADGGPVAEVRVTRWDWGERTGRLVVRTTASGLGSTARLTVTDRDGHPVIPNAGQPRFDGQNGVTFFYSPGTIELEVPAGEATVTAVRGLATPPAQGRVTIVAGATRVLDLTLRPVWNARAAGWYSGDHHFHLNYGGPFQLQPQRLLPLMMSEDLDVATPLLANLHVRFEDQDLWKWRRSNAPPFVVWAQEVRSHFLGHVGLLDTKQLFWPWIWGPGYEVHARDDRPNAEPLRFAHAQGGMGVYVHPVIIADPFANAASLERIPTGFVADAAQGLVDLLEVVCLWSNPTGTSELWHRLLNLGVPIAPQGGTDVMLDFGRTMAVGVTRVFVRPEGRFTYETYMSALKAGRSFVTNGPMLEFALGGGVRPGGVLARGGDARFELSLHSAVPVTRVEVLVNGAVAWRGEDGIDSAGTRRYQGTLTLPAGGWVAARAVGPATLRWPAMDVHAFAHTSPVWIGRRGSTEPLARAAAARDLLRALDVAAHRLETGYAGVDIPVLRAHFAAARRMLESQQLR